MNINANRLKIVATAIILAGTTTSALATTQTTTYNVTASVQATCLISGSSLGFGTYTGALINAQTTVSVQCTNGTTYNVGLNAGMASGATVSTRAMTGPGSATLNYAMYQDSSHTTNWGNTAGTDTVAGTGNGNSQSITVYGQLAASQFVTPGSYSDTITATVTY